MCLFARRTFILCSFFISLYLPRSRLSISMFFLINNSSSFRRLYMCFFYRGVIVAVFFCKNSVYTSIVPKMNSKPKMKTNQRTETKKDETKHNGKTLSVSRYVQTPFMLFVITTITIIHSSLAMIPGLWILIFRDYVCLFVVVVARRRILFLDDSFLLCVCIFCCCIFFVYNIMQW